MENCSYNRIEIEYNPDEDGAIIMIEPVEVVKKECSANCLLLLECRAKKEKGISTVAIRNGIPDCYEPIFRAESCAACPVGGTCHWVSNFSVAETFEFLRPCEERTRKIDTLPNGVINFSITLMGMGITKKSWWDRVNRNLARPADARGKIWITGVYFSKT